MSVISDRQVDAVMKLHKAVEVDLYDADGENVTGKATICGGCQDFAERLDLYNEEIVNDGVLWPCDTYRVMSEVAP